MVFDKKHANLRNQILYIIVAERDLFISCLYFKPHLSYEAGFLSSLVKNQGAYM